MLAPIFVFAQVPVVESNAVDHSTASDAAVAQNSASSSNASSTNSANAQLFYQLQLLQEEVMRMQGLIEQQQYQVDQLKKQHLDDYISIDKRLSEMQAGSSRSTAVPIVPLPVATGASGSVPSGTSNGGNVPADTITPTTAAPATAKTTAGAVAVGKVAGTSGNKDDQVAYRKAYDLIKQKSFSDAKTAFEAFLKDYPNSPYAGNALYWLGELYILDLDYANAEKSFNAIITQHPDHAKVAEAHYKLGKIYFDQGKKDAAKQQMETVIEQYSGKADHVVDLAKAFLQKHFS